jgi:hypothetical protein
MKKVILTWALIFSGLVAVAQSENHFSGYITSSFSGRTLSDVHISIPNDSLHVFTNSHGFFNVITSNDSFTILIEKPGYTKTEIRISLSEKSGKPSSLEPRKRQFLKPGASKITADEEGIFHLTIEPIYNSEFTHYSPSSMSGQFLKDIASDKIVMDRSELDATPFIYSEPDVSKALQIHAGVEFAKDGFSDMTVRGGGLGQNQMLLDGVPVYSLGHFEGYGSNFNTIMTEEVTLYKAAFPARHGGRLASVTEVKSNAGNAEETTVDLAVSPALANIGIGIPLDDNGSSLGVNFRRSYVDLLLDLQGQELFFRDFNTKLHVNMNPKNSLTLSFFSLKDKIKVSGSEFNDTNTNALELDFTYDLTFKNQTTSANWRHIINKKLSASTTAYYTNYSNGVTLLETDYTAPIGSNAISDYVAKFSAGEVGLNGDFEYRRNKKMLLRFGIQNRLHLNNSGSLVDKKYTIDNVLISDDQYGDTVLQTGIETSLYVEDEYTYSNKLAFNLGLRTTIYSYHNFTRLYPEPRFSGRYLLSKKSTLKFSYARMHQFMHLYNTDGAATDNFLVYLPASENLKPQASDIITFSYHTKPASKIRFSSEAYFKILSNQPIFYAADLFDRGDMEANSLSGTGVVMGIENSFKYVSNNSILWASATFSKATRKYDELNRGESFSFDYDRRIVGKFGYILNMENFVFSVFGVGATGNPFTLPTSKYRDIDGGVVLAYDEINNYRSTYHARVDAKFEWHFVDEVQSIELSIYNVLGNKNVQSIFSERDDQTTNYKFTAFTESSHAFLPFLTYRVKI